MAKDSARGSAAFRVAGVDRDKFNTFVSEGAYPCAPPTRAGSGRLFELHDLIALKVFDDLIAVGAKAPYAGERACMIRDFAMQQPSAEVAIIVFPTMGSPIMWNEPIAPGAALGDGRHAMRTEGFDLARYRNLIRAALADEDRTVGADD